MALTFHLGAHKTASTHLQQALCQARPDLWRAGVFYADPWTLRGQGVDLARLLTAGAATPGEMARFARSLRNARETCPDLLISEENILGRTGRRRLVSRDGEVYPEATPRLQRMIALAGGGPATLFLSVRDPAAFNLSVFALQVGKGKEFDYAMFLNGRDPAWIGWAGLVERLSTVPGVGGVVVWRYEDYAALRPRLLARMLPPALAAAVPDLPPLNESLTQAGYDWFVRVAMDDPEVDLRVLARRARMLFPRAQGYAPLKLLPDAVRARSSVLYARDLVALARLPGVELLTP